MKTILLIVFGAVSLVVGLSFLVRALYVYKVGKRAKRVLSAIQVYTIGVFASVVLIFVPIYYTSYDFGDAYNFFRPLLIAIHNSLRIFILDGDFDIIVKSINDQNVLLRVCFSLYSAFLRTFPIGKLRNVFLCRNVLLEYLLGELGELHLIGTLGAGIEHVGLSLAELPQGLCLANTPSAVQDDQLAPFFLILALQERQFRFSADKHNCTS